MCFAGKEPAPVTTTSPSLAGIFLAASSNILSPAARRIAAETPPPIVRYQSSELTSTSALDLIMSPNSNDNVERPTLYVRRFVTEPLSADRSDVDLEFFRTGVRHVRLTENVS